MLKTPVVDSSSIDRTGKSHSQAAIYSKICSAVQAPITTGNIYEGRFIFCSALIPFSSPHQASKQTNKNSYPDLSHPL